MLDTLRFWRIAATLVAWFVGALIFFRYPILSGFDSVFGNDADPRSIVYYHEHLYSWLLGKVEFLSPPFYYPQKYLLGYNEAFLLNLIPYSIFRACGLDPFLSFQIWIILASAVCFFSCVVIFVGYLGVRYSLALAGAALLTFSNGLCMAASHPQLYAVYYLPALTLIFLRGFEEFPRATSRLLMHLAAGSLLFGLLFATSFYTAWLFALTCIIAVIVLVCSAWRDVTQILLADARPIGIMFGVSFAAFVIGLIPFAIIYAPTLSSVGPRSYGEALSYGPFPKDIFNVSVFNLVWGWLVERLMGNARLEATWVVTPAVGFTFLWLSWRGLCGNLRLHLKTWEITLIGVSAAVAIFSTLITTRIGTVSPYWLVYHLIPGAEGIRAVGRIQLLVNLWVIVGLIVLLDRVWRIPFSMSVSKYFVLAGSVFFLLIEQINLSNNGILSRRLQLDRLANVPPPLPECRAFLIAISRSATKPVDMFSVNVDALWISNKTGLPTINGVTGATPPNYNLDDPTIDYADAALQWITRNRLDHVCMYNRATRQWSPFPAPG